MIGGTFGRITFCCFWLLPFHLALPLPPLVSDCAPLSDDVLGGISRAESWHGAESGRGAAEGVAAGVVLGGITCTKALGGITRAES